MGTTRRPRVLSERQGRWMLNLYPPLLFQRIRVVRIGSGFRSGEVDVARSWLTRNLHGTTFGGTIFAAADPIYAILYWQVFARRGLHVRTWLRNARIDYRRPAATALRLSFALTESDIDSATDALAREGRFAARHETSATDRSGRVCAEIETEVHLSVPRKGERADEEGARW